MEMSAVKETVKYDVHEKVVSKTVVKTVNKTVIINNYDHGHYGYVYHPCRESAADCVSTIPLSTRPRG